MVTKIYNNLQKIIIVYKVLTIDIKLVFPGKVGNISLISSLAVIRKRSQASCLLYGMSASSTKIEKKLAPSQTWSGTPLNQKTKEPKFRFWKHKLGLNYTIIKHNVIICNISYLNGECRARYVGSSWTKSLACSSTSLRELMACGSRETEWNRFRDTSFRMAIIRIIRRSTSRASWRSCSR